ncbi:hypothetical protein GK047_25560 [Paenibacillus sp. SYP-B3998]|uniref:Uncharacterized protein n=1 Tax=Paenibacillus sp. SYP-B3998 TaxID=2678564 RepID=A0A6G4A482_9BACL|nr:hypothetical protein [Paenibacillus sp. SYP-B3998]NEW09316.1 hypothetical protein [Paenibacillus sp. SYP-B3998]
MKISISLKQIIVGVSIVFIIVGFTPLGKSIRVEAAKTLITTRYQQETRILVGKEKRDELIKELYDKYGIE